MLSHPSETRSLYFWSLEMSWFQKWLCAEFMCLLRKWQLNCNSWIMVEHKTKSYWVEEQKREMEKNRAVCGSLTTPPEDYPFS